MNVHSPPPSWQCMSNVIDSAGEINIMIQKKEVFCLGCQRAKHDCSKRITWRMLASKGCTGMKDKGGR